MRKHTYVSAERFILSREFFGMKLGLDNITGFLGDIGSPQTRYPTIHISGTNGKGSTSALIDSILRAAGFKCGLYTSPHLTTLRERIRIDGQLIPKRSVTAFIDRHRRALAGRKLSFFELMTAMAFEHFSRQKVDVAVIETGLGGRLDASNVLRPELTITTEVSRDHTEILGDTISRIAFEKAGIIKTETPHLIGLMPREAEAVFRNRCRQMGARLVKVTGRDFRADIDTMTFDMKANGVSVKRQSVGLFGEHQLQNAALAVRAASLLKERGWPITRSAVSRGLESVDWPGRFQIVKKRGWPTVILDVSHNRAGAETLARSFRARFPGRKAKTVIGLVKRKEHQLIFDNICSISSEINLVPLASHRTVDMSEIIGAIDFHSVPVSRHRSLPRAFQRVLNSCNSDDIILVVGSHYLVGEFIERFHL